MCSSKAFTPGSGWRTPGAEGLCLGAQRHGAQCGLAHSFPFFLQLLGGVLERMHLGGIMLDGLVVAGRRIETQPRHNLVGDQMFRNNRIDIFGLDVRVPGRFRIDDDHRPMPTLIEAAGAIDTHFLIQAVSANLPLHTFEDGFGVAIETAVGALCANKNMFLIL